MATISTHNGSKLSQRHNRRDRKITDKEEHIDKNGEYGVWLDRDIKEAYVLIFDKAREEYNATQKRKDRRIEDYYQKIEKDQKKHVAYEMIVGVYGDDSTPQQKKAILYEFAKGWKDRNPNLRMVGCYWHNDEEGEQHIHIDYIPVYRSEKGMKLQNGLNKALAQQGIEGGTSIHETPQILWERRENLHLESLCNAHGVGVERKDFARDHEDTKDFKLRRTMRENRELKQENEELRKGYQAIYEAAVNLKKENEELKRVNKELDEELHYHPIDEFRDKGEWADDWDLRR